LSLAVLGFAFWRPVGVIILAGGIYSRSRPALLHSFALDEWTLLPDLALCQKFAASGKSHWGFGRPQGGQNFCWGPRLSLEPPLLERLKNLKWSRFVICRLGRWDLLCSTHILNLKCLRLPATKI